MTTYPPDRHVLRDLGHTTERVARDHAVVRAVVRPELCGPSGGVRAGVLACLVDVTGAMVALGAVLPDWTATADLAYHARRPIREGPVVMTARPIRAGRSIVVVGCEVRDGLGDDGVDSGEPAGIATMTFARIPGSASSITPAAIEEGVGRTTSMALPDSGFRAPFHEALGLRFVDPAAGIVEVDKTGYVRNSFGTINGGVVAATLAAAAEAAGAAATGAPVETLDLQVHYLAQTKEGPARTTADVLRHDDRSAVVRLELHDVSDGTLLALATVGVGVPAA